MKAIDSSSALHGGACAREFAGTTSPAVSVYGSVPMWRSASGIGLDEGEIEVDSLLPFPCADITPAIARFGFHRSRRPPQGRETRAGRKLFLVRFHYVPPGSADPANQRRSDGRRAATGRAVRNRRELRAVQQ